MNVTNVQGLTRLFGKISAQGIHNLARFGLKNWTIATNSDSMEMILDELKKMPYKATVIEINNMRSFADPLNGLYAEAFKSGQHALVVSHDVLGLTPEILSETREFMVQNPSLLMAGWSIDGENGQRNSGFGRKIPWNTAMMYSPEALETIVKYPLHNFVDNSYIGKIEAEHEGEKMLVQTGGIEETVIIGNLLRYRPQVPCVAIMPHQNITRTVKTAVSERPDGWKEKMFRKVIMSEFYIKVFDAILGIGSHSFVAFAVSMYRHLCE